MNHNFPCTPEGGKISQLNPIIDYYKSILGIYLMFTLLPHTCNILYTSSRVALQYGLTLYLPFFVCVNTFKYLKLFATCNMYFLFLDQDYLQVV